MNSDMSMRVIAFSSFRTKSPRALHNSVLPTPVGPRNKNTPCGRSWARSPNVQGDQLKDFIKD